MTALPARAFALAGLGLLALGVSASAQSPEEIFEIRVRPVLAGKCLDCHGRLTRGRLKLNSREAMLKGGRSGPAIVPGDPESSLLIQVVRHQIEGKEMPEDGDPLTEQEIAGLIEWIRLDAPWPAVAQAELVVEDEGLSPSAQLYLDRVRPVLTQRCYSCHTDEERSGLRLDSRERILQGGTRGPAIVPGNAEGSLLIQAIRHEHAELRMPKDADRLSGAEIEGIAEWIQSGAEWAESAAPMVIPRRAVTAEDRSFWSFLPLTKPDVPLAAPVGSAHEAIDHFVDAGLAEKGLTAAGPADRRRLIRRATFDLTGLPPTPAEVDAFLADDSPEAFEHVVDRLLASAHYGERWGRHWLDVARYGEDDTRGLAPDGSGRERYPSAYVYRDWVVKAFNDDMPWDLFVKGQLAGDLLAEEDREKALGGLGFLGGGPWSYDLAEPPIARSDERHDRVDVTTRGFLGLTVGCARCHDHKYDAIGTHDYYALAGVFNNTNYHEYPVAEPEIAKAYEADKKFIKGLSDGLTEYLNTESGQLARVLALQTSQYMMAAWRVTGEPQIPAARAAAQGKLDLETLQRWIRFLAKEPKNYPFVKPWQEMLAEDGGTEERAQGLADDFQRLVLEVSAEQKKLEERNRKIIAKGTPLEEVKSTPMPNGFESFFDQHQLELDTMERERFNLFLDMFRFDLDNQLDTFFPEPGLFVFRGWSLERQLSRVSADHVTATREEIDKLEKDLPDLPFVMGVEDKPEEDLTEIGLHIRGNPKNLGEKVPAGFPLVLSGPDPKPFEDGSGRLELAEAIATHPLTARVIVNRVWRWHMGSGIVDTPSNFGKAGDRPSNPELLEWLTSRFVENGMSLKQLHKDIMLTAAYQRTTVRDAANERVDGANRFYWRANRQRLDAEGIRDALLSVAGTLDPKVGGKSMRIADGENVRRTLYSEVSRFQLDEYLQIFDFPNPGITAERRFTTNVPLQSLFFMNSEFVRVQAEHLVRRLAAKAAETSVAQEQGGAAHQGDGGADPAPQEAPKDTLAAKDSIPESFDDRAMIRIAYPLLYGRPVTETEVEAGLAFLGEQRASHLPKELAAIDSVRAAEEAEAEKKATAAAADSTATMVGVEGDTAADPGAEPSDEERPEDRQALAERRASMKAWVQYVRALFSAAEFRFID